MQETALHNLFPALSAAPAVTHADVMSSTAPVASSAHAVPAPTAAAAPIVHASVSPTAQGVLAPAFTSPASKTSHQAMSQQSTPASQNERARSPAWTVDWVQHQWALPVSISAASGMKVGSTPVMMRMSPRKVTSKAAAQSAKRLSMVSSSSASTSVLHAATSGAPSDALTQGTPLKLGMSAGSSNAAKHSSAAMTSSPGLPSITPRRSTRLLKHQATPLAAAAAVPSTTVMLMHSYAPSVTPVAPRTWTQAGDQFTADHTDESMHSGVSNALTTPGSQAWAGEASPIAADSTASAVAMSPVDDALLGRVDTWQEVRATKSAVNIALGAVSSRDPAAVKLFTTGGTLLSPVRRSMRNMPAGMYKSQLSHSLRSVTTPGAGATPVAGRYLPPTPNGRHDHARAVEFPAEA